MNVGFVGLGRMGRPMVERLKNGRVRVSRATVYRTLELLRECQLVEKLDFGSPRSFVSALRPALSLSPM